MGLLLSLGAPGPAPVSAQEVLRLPVPELETLPNGLQVAWFLSDKLPVVDLALLVKAGSRDDRPGKSGTAELLSSVLERGAAGMSARELARAVEMLGASRYVSADEDTFSLGMHGLAPDAGVLLELLAKLALRPDFPEAEVKREHARLLDRWSHLGDTGEALASLTLRRLLTYGTPYGRGGFSSAAEFAGVTRADLIEFHRLNFTPGNAILMVVGRVEKRVFREKVLQAFGGWTGAAPARSYSGHSDRRLRRFALRNGKPAGTPVVVVNRPGLTQAQVRIGSRAPLFQAPEHYALVVGNAMLGEYFNSRLNGLIRDKLGLTYGIGSGFSYSKDFASFGISSATRNESVGKLIRESLKALEGMKSGPIPPEELKTAKEYLIGGFPLSTATLGAVAARWLNGTVHGLGPGYLNEFVPRVERVASADVIAAMGANFDPRELMVVVAGDAREIEKGLAGHGLGPILRLELKELL